MKSLKTIAVQVAVKILNQPSVLTLPFFAVVAWATWAVRGHFFFWDTVQLASHRLFFEVNTKCAGHNAEVCKRYSDS